jgi:hypothetical protein
MLTRSLLGCVLFCLSLPSFAFGEWEFSGFASIGAGKLDQEDVRYIDFTDEWSMNSDSVLGLQAQVEISDRWSFISQVVASGTDFTPDDPYTPKLEWFVLGYQISPSMQMRIGRIRAPQYLYSTTLEVGYTYQWVRPSQNAYPLFFSPFKHLDGIDFSQNFSLNDVDLGYQAYIGLTEGEYEGTFAESEYTFGGNLYASWSNFSVRVSGQHLKASIESSGFDDFVAGYQGVAATLTPGSDAEQAFLTVADSFDVNGQKVNYLSLGLTWGLGDWTLESEILNFRSEDRNYSNDADGYYVSAAYQWGDVSPYVMIGEYHNRLSDDIKNKAMATEQYIAQGVAPNVDELRAKTVAVMGLFNVNQETITLGVRYDFHPQADFKFEVEYFNFLNDSYGNFYPTDMFEKGRTAVLTSFVIDVVF